MEYGFNTELAQKLGLNEAIIIRHFQYWIDKNKANDKNFYEGRYWTYNSLSAFCKIFPFWSKDQIRYTIKKLSDKNILIVGTFNKNTYDRTTWYSLNEEVIADLMMSDNVDLPDEDDVNLPNACGKIPKSMCENSQIHVGNFPHGSGKIPTPIPHVDTCNEPCNNTHTDECKFKIFSIESGVDEFCKDYKAIKGCDFLTNKEREEILKVLKKENGYDKEFWCAVFKKSLGGWEINEGGRVRKAPCGLMSILENYGEIYRNEKGLKKISSTKSMPISTMPLEPEMEEVDEAALAEAKKRAREICEGIRRRNLGFG